MSLRAVSVMVLVPLIATVGAVLVLTPKDILRQPVVDGAALTAGAVTALPAETAPTEPASPPRAPVISLSDLAPPPEPEPTEEAAVEPEAAPVPPSADRRWIAASGGLNLRNGPGVDNRLIASLPYGTPVEVLEAAGTWVRVETAEHSGWLSANFLTTDRPSGVN